MPLQRRVPKRGFRRLLRNLALRERFAEVNLSRLVNFADGDQVNPDTLAQSGVIRPGKLIKVLGGGELKVKLTVRAHAFSATAREKITQAGGVAELIEGA